MKKLFTTVCMLLGIYSFTFAQKTESTMAGKTEFGFGLGVNGSYVTQNAAYATSTGLIWAFTAHVSAEQYINDNFGIKIKASFDPKGWGDGIYVSPDGNKKITGVYYSLKYITIPVTFNWHFGSEKNWYAMAGPYAGFLLNATNDYDHQDMKSRFNSFDAGADLGLGLQFPVSDKLNLFFEYDGQIGASNILKFDSSGAQNVKSGFTVGLKF